MNMPPRHGLTPAHGGSDELADGGRAARFVAAAAAIGLVVRRHRIILFVTMALCMLAGVCIILLSTPDYQATASVEVEDVPAGAAGTGANARINVSPPDTESLMQTQLEVLRSRALAQDVARELKLAGNDRFFAAMDRKRPQQGLGALGQKQVEAELVEQMLRGNLVSDLPGKSRIISIGFVSADPVMSARIANAYAAMLIRADLRRGFESGVQARRFLLGELDGARRDLERAERDLATYAAQLAPAADPQADGATLETRLAQLNAFRAQAVSDRIAAQKRWESARGASATTLPDVLANGAIQQLMQQRAQAQAALVEQRQFRKDAHPEVREARAKVAALDDQIERLGQTIRTSMHEQFTIAQRGEKQIAQEIADVERAAGVGRGRDMQIGMLERQVDTFRTLHDSLLQRYRDMASQAGFQAGRIQPLDHAAVPARPTSPNIGTTMLLASFGGLALGLMLVAARHIFDDAVTSAETLAERIDLPLLGTAPMLNDGEALPPGAMRSIAQSLLLASVDGLPKSILITSAQANEGKSTIVHALALSLGELGKRVLVVDCDMRHPAQHVHFRLGSGAGISAVMTGQAVAQDVIVATAVPEISVLPGGAVPPNPAELLSTRAFDTLLGDFATRYDTVLIDAPPILGLTDAPLIAAKAQATLLVIESGRNHHGGLRVAVDRLRRAGGAPIGAILTRHQGRSQGYDYHRDG